MTELKTLKDLDFSKLEFREKRASEYLTENIKQEAIKWIKNYKKERIRISKMSDSPEKMLKDFGAFSLIREFEHFFNITEEDLK